MLDDFPKVEREYNELKELLARSRGRYDETLRRIKDRYGCPTLAAAEKMLKELQDKRQELAGRYLTRFKKMKRQLELVKEKLGESGEDDS